MTATTPVFASESGRRAFPRVELPMAVSIEGLSYETLDWSLGGFGLATSQVTAKLGDLLPARLAIRLPAFEMAIDTVVRIVRVEGDRATGFQYIDLPPEKVRILRHVIDSHLAGDLVVLDDLLGVEGGVIAPTSRATRAARAALGVVRFAGLLVVAVSLIGFGGLSIASTFLTVRSEYAAVAAGQLVLRAPETGFLRGDVLVPGARIRAGDALVEIAQATTPRDIAQKQAELHRLTKQLEGLSSALAEAHLAMEGYRDRLAIEIEGAHNRIAGIERQLSVQKDALSRAERLESGALMSRSSADAARLNVLHLEGERDQALHELKLLESALTQALRGLYAEDRRGTRETPGDIGRRIRDTQALIELKDQEIRNLQDRYAIASPCDCVVEVVHARAGEFIERGSPVYSLGRDHNGSWEVDALVPLDKAKFLSIGMEASLLFADSPQPIPARVEDVLLKPDVEGRAGLPAPLVASGKYARVLLRPQGDLGETSRPTGLPAVATFSIRPLTLLHYLTGWSWFSEASDIF